MKTRYKLSDSDSSIFKDDVMFNDIRIKAHFLICFLALVIYRYLERDLENAISYETILDKLRTMKRPGIKYYIPKQHKKSPNLSKIKRYSNFFV